MFTDWHEALEAFDGLPLNPANTEQETAAARTLARGATSKEDLLPLLDAVGLPSDDDTLMQRDFGRSPRLPEPPCVRNGLIMPARRPLPAA
ncbi:hypothetical protein ACH4F6_37145 [Streptomyces sp. NPDC017936]|uniref:hypothetical protein n=1 Tax=Streptomyces sp. NPDC017936 TaxID=3365016 RepID=UPI00379692E7